MLFDDIPRAAVLANRSIAIATVWLGAVLVGVLNRRRAELQHDVERQQRFVDILSHEIRNALTAVGGHAQRLAKLSEKLTPSDVAARADKIRGAAARIEAIISRVQFASSLGNGMVPMLRDDVDLNALVRQLIDRLKEEHEERLIELDLSPETLRIHGDEVLLRHAIENVVLNSLQYSPKGSRVLVHTTATGSGMRITIADFGPGIAPDDLTRIREPYFRGANGESRSGTGLGLYFADRIVQGHKGSVQIDSALGKGTTVTIEVPASDKAVRA
jgi:signal transduction histidine kinase